MQKLTPGEEEREAERGRLEELLAACQHISLILWFSNRMRKAVAIILYTWDIFF